MGILSGSAPLLWTLTLSLVLGILYSMDLPFMRWKKFPWLAAGCILSVRAVFVQLGFYYHIRHALGTAQIALNPSLVFTMGFMLAFSIVIALFKDIPDVKGDQEAGEGGVLGF
jgi:homogentisate phytyltransferase/homogentisate geranylgeranyltransferase